MTTFRRAAGPEPAVTLAIVGVGYWGPNIVRNAQELDGVELSCVCDSDPRALKAIHRRDPAVPTTTRFQDVINDDSIDALAIVTPVSTHYPLAAAALEARKHVLVEKPLAPTADEASALVALAESADVCLMPAHTFLYSPPVVKIKELIDSGGVGDIYFLSMSRVNLGIHQADVSVITDLGPHDFSILRYWLGETPTRVSALSRDCVGSGTCDVAFVDLEYASGAIAHVELSWLSPSKLRRTTVVGSERMVVYDDVSTEPVRIFDSGVAPRNPENFGEYRLTYRTGDIIAPRIETREPLLVQLSDFVSAIRTRGEPRSSAALGVDVVRVIDAAHRSLEFGGTQVPIFPAASSLRAAS
jgi:predicted dehydrogenase